MLEVIAFLCGASVMVLEITGSRLLAPYLGSSILVWTALIGTIMGFLSAGYWFGGKFADKNPSTKKLGGIITASAFCVLFLILFQEALLETLTNSISRTEPAALVASAMLFGPASLLLGMVSPYIVRVALQTRKVPLEKSGAILGRFYACSTIGSIAGTFLGGYLFIAWVGSRLTMYWLASTLMCVAILAFSADYVRLSRKKIFILIPLAGLFLGIFFGYVEYLRDFTARGSNRFSLDTRYNYLELVQGKNAQGRMIQLLNTPPHLTQSSMYLDKPYELALYYTRHFSLAWQLRPEAKRFLMLGGAGYSVPKYLLHTRKDAVVHVVEIDPAMTEIAKEYFALTDDHPRLEIFHEDARVYLNRYSRELKKDIIADNSRYQIIMGDTFSSVYNIPFQMSTVECAQKIYDILDTDGVFICNVISAITGEKALLLRGMRASLEQVFPQVHVFPISGASPSSVQSLMLVAVKTPKILPSAAELRAAGVNTELAKSFPQEAEEELLVATGMLKMEWRIRSQDELPLYDNFAPVERYALKLLP